MSFDLIIQARFNSTRLRGKVFLTIGKRKNSLDLIVDSIRKVKEIKKIILAVPDDYFSDIFEEYAKNKKIHFYKSKKIEENNLLKRFFLAAEAFKSKKIIRITSDCPFINFYSVISMIKKFKEKNLEFLTNNKPRFVPHGFDCEIFTYGMLKKIYHNAKKKYDKEHVTPWFYDNLFKKKNNYKFFKKNYSNLRLTLDTQSDYKAYILNFKKYYRLSQSKNPEIFIKKFNSNKTNKIF